KAAPANDNDAPTQKASRTRGRRIFQIINSSFFGTSSNQPIFKVLSKIICTIVGIGNETLLINKPTRAVPSTSPPLITYSQIILFFEYFWVDKLGKCFHSFN